MNNMTAEIVYYDMITNATDTSTINITIGDLGSRIFDRINDGTRFPLYVSFYEDGNLLTAFDVPDSGYLMLISILKQMRQNGATDEEFYTMICIIQEVDYHVWEANDYKKFVQKMIEKYVNFI